VTIKTLTERLALSGSRLTRIVDELENKGLVTRAFHQEDRRSILVILTKRGATIAKQLENRYIQIHEEILTEFPCSSRRCFPTVSDNYSGPWRNGSTKRVIAKKFFIRILAIDKYLKPELLDFRTI